MLIIQQVTPDETPALRELRLEAVREEPEAFYSSYEDDLAQDPLAFMERIASQQDDSFVLAARDGARFVGMIGFVRETRDKGRHKGFIWGMYVTPSHRGRGIGRELVDAVLERTSAQEGLRVVQLGVATVNEAAIGLYERAGFFTYGTEPAAMIVDGRELEEHLMACFVDGRRP